MSLRTGLASSVGWKSEVTFGLPVVVDTFLPLVSESMVATVDRLESKANYAGREVLDSAEWFPGGIHVAGNVGLELCNKSSTTLFKNMLGAASSPFTPSDLSGTSMTVQIGRPGVNGTIQPFTYAGVKVNQWEIACKAGEIATLGLDLVARAEYRYRTVADGVLNTTVTVTSATAQFSQSDVGMPISATGIPAATTIASVESATSITLSAAATASASSVAITLGQALASVSYTSGVVPYIFRQGTVTIGGTAYNIKSASLKGDNKLPDDRRFLGTPLTSEPYSNDQREFTGSLEAELSDLTLYNLYVRGVEAAVVLNFTAGATSIVITTNARFDGTTPNSGGRGVLQQMLPFKCLGTSDAAAVSIAVA